MKMGLEKDIESIQGLTQESKSAQSEANEKVFELREKILGGESTGDLIRDFVIVNALSFSEEYEKPYRETAEKLNNKSGSQVLVVDERKDLLVHSSLPMSSYESWMIGIKEILRLGVLTGELEFDVKEGYVIFPTQNHALKYDKFHGEWELQEGAIRIASRDFVHLGNDIKIRTRGCSSLSDLEKSLKIFLDDEVREYFEKDKIDYVKALDLLGQEVPLEMRKHYDKFVHDQKTGLVDSLKQLMRKERELGGKNQSVYDSISTGVHSSGVGLTVVEDEDDAAFVSAGSSAELDKVKSQIRNHLRKAAELRMHKDDLKLKQGPGIEMDVSKYISGMCEHYEVKVPE